MAGKKYSIEFPIHSSINILFKRLSTPSGLAEWFADDVSIKNNTFIFHWEDSQQSAELVKKKENEFIKFRWADNKEGFFEFRIEIDDMTSDVSLIVTDFAEDEDEEQEGILLWETQIENLRRALGS